MFHSWISQEGTPTVMALSPEDVRYLRHWQVSIQCLLRDPDLDFVRCLRIISERIVPQLVPAVNLEEHRRQTKSSAQRATFRKMLTSTVPSPKKSSKRRRK